MKISEFKLKTINGINGLIDTYFGTPSISDKFLNTTLKIIVMQNQNKYDDILNLFADENGEINEKMIMEEYSNVLGDNGFVVDLRNYVKNDIIKQMLPNKALKITKDDIIDILS